MKWVTRRDVKVEGVACPWLITRFIDEDAEFGFVAPSLVLEVAEREGARSFDAPGARYEPRDGKCSFEALIDQFGLVAPGLDGLSRIVHATAVPGASSEAIEAPGLNAIAEAFAVAVESDIERQRLQWPIYDALLAWCAQRDDEAI